MHSILKKSNLSYTLILYSCLTCSVSLLNHPWPKKNLRLPGCQEVKALNRELVFAGARVRMGIHWANIPDLANLEQGGDKLRHILKAPAVDFAKAISDAGHTVCLSLPPRHLTRLPVGNGGQILLSEAAWFQLRPATTVCKFPTVCQLGLYRMRARDNSFEQHRIYTITERLGSGLVRIFPQIRNFEPVMSAACHRELNSCFRFARDWDST